MDDFNSIILEFRGDMQYAPSKQRLEVRLKSKLWRGLQAVNLKKDLHSKL